MQFRDDAEMRHSASTIEVGWQGVKDVWQEKRSVGKGGDAAHNPVASRDRAYQ